MSVVPVIRGEPSSLTWRLWCEGVWAAATDPRRTRYTSAKALRYFEYAASTSRWRHVAVVAAMPLPGLLAALVPPLIPLQDPLAGVAKNWGFALHLFITSTFAMSGVMFQVRASTSIDHSLYTKLDIFVAAVVGSAHIVGVFTLLGYVWRFPVPFALVLCFAPWLLSLVWGNLLVLRSRLTQSSHLRTRLLFCIPSMLVQLSQIVIYPVYSAAFEASGQWGQYALISFLPFLKWVLKRTILALSHHLADFAEEISVSGVEISATMYQAMIMQSTPSKFATALVIGLDVLQGLLELKMFADHDSCVPNAEILAIAMRGLRDRRPSFDKSLQRFATKAISVSPRGKLLATKVVVPRDPQIVDRRREDSHSRGTGPTIDENDKLVLTQALELLQAAESLLLVEYLEVAVPIANAMYLCVASQLSSAIYNPKLQAFYKQPDALQAAVASVLLYASLQAATLLLMCMVMRVRYHISPLVILAFLLEDHAWSLQGKMLAWLPTVLAFSVLQYGMCAAGQDALTIRLIRHITAPRLLCRCRFLISVRLLSRPINLNPLKQWRQAHAIWWRFDNEPRLLNVTTQGYSTEALSTTQYFEVRTQ